MAYLTDETEIYSLVHESETQSKQWRKDYKEFERLADNDLIANLDDSLPEVNDGSLAAALFKLPKRIVNSRLVGRFISIDRDELWMEELANIVWEDQIIPNANSQASFHRKLKDAVRKAAIYGSVPLVTIFVERGDYIGADFVVAQPQDVKLEPGKVSDYDSDVFVWEVYYSKLQLKSLIERAKEETAESKESGEVSYNTWNVPALEKILASTPEDQRDSDEEHNQVQDVGVYKQGYKFCVIPQRGVDAPFYMYYKSTKKTVREWTNPDPSGDVNIHMLYCYQDFINPYGTGVVKLAGGTQNVLDYMRQADVLATQLGFRPPVKISGRIEEVDLDSIVYAQDAQWFVGNATVERQEIANSIYAALPDRMAMYKISLNQLIPTGDTSISSGSGDTNYSKTPAGVKFQESSLSIDDDDFRDNLYMTYEALAKSMVNTHFANMQGSDILKLSDDQKQRLIKAGFDGFTDPDTGEPLETNELEVVWDEVRTTFNFKMDAEQDKADNEEKRLTALLKIYELRQADPMTDQKLLMAGKRVNDGKLLAEIFSLTSDNKDIIEDVPEEEILAQQGQIEEEKALQNPRPQAPQGAQEGQLPEENPEQDAANVQAIMETYKIDEGKALAMLEAEKQGYDPQEILDALEKQIVQGEAEDEQ